MTQDRHLTLRGAPQAFRFARAGFERPVEHLHFDRVARVWRRHGDHEAVEATTASRALYEVSE